jgi:hypothetical protein
MTTATVNTRLTELLHFMRDELLAFDGRPTHFNTGEALRDEHIARTEHHVL